MKKTRAERPIFARNIIKARRALGWSQEKASKLLGITHKALGSYEEGRAQPELKMIPTFVTVYGITNVIAFLENPDFSHHDQDKEFTVAYESPLEKMYHSAPAKERKIVDLALGIIEE